VFLIAVPLGLGISIASGAPPELGLITGIVGGVLVGTLAGSPLQVSGPAAGLAVIVFELIRDVGLSALGPILMIAGLIQFAAGVLKLGQWFRAISPAVVHGMLAGIGVLIVASQIHVILDAKPQASGLANILAAPAAYFGLFSLDGSKAGAAFIVGMATIVALVVWEMVRPERLSLLPGALVGVVAGTAVAAILTLPVTYVTIPSDILSSIRMPGAADLARLTEPKILVLAFAIAFIASAETLLSASAVDRMHDGPRTNYNRELSAQGVGNLVCGLLGALPMTGVIVRSSANVQAGAVTRWSSVLHGVWILGAVALLPWMLQSIPMAALAGVLIVTGVRLVSLRHAKHLFESYGALPAAIWAVTFATIIATDLLTGVLVGIGLSLVELVPWIKRLRLRIERKMARDGSIDLTLVGTATFVQLPILISALEATSNSARVALHTDNLLFIDHTCVDFLRGWVARQRENGGAVSFVDRLERPDRKAVVSLQGCEGRTI
jgi:MFS superfamily sulfate permease-like transporter